MPTAAKTKAGSSTGTGTGTGTGIDTETDVGLGVVGEGVGVEWEKVLYKKQPFPDNYVDPHRFMACLASAPPPQQPSRDSFFKLFVAASVIARQIALVMIFVSVHQHLLLDGGSVGSSSSSVHKDGEGEGKDVYSSWSFWVLVHLDVSLVVGGYAISLRAANLIDSQSASGGTTGGTSGSNTRGGSGKPSPAASSSATSASASTGSNSGGNGNTSGINASTAFKASALTAMLLRIFAPVFQTLTSSYSEDTLYALSVICAVVHIVFFDYAFALGDSSAFSNAGVLSLNAAFVTAILFVSRYNDMVTVSLFVLLAVILFAFFPIIARRVRLFSLRLDMTITLLLCVGAALLNYYSNFTLFVTYLVLLVFIWLVCPLWLNVFMQYKRPLKGPWEI
jgi:hypothetical protein